MRSTKTIRRVMAVVVALAVVAGCASAGRGRTGGPTSSGSEPTNSPTTAPPAAATGLATGKWSTLPEAPISPRQGASVVWTGRELLVWGGQSGPNGDILHSDGAAYDPVTRAWRQLPAGPLSGRVGQAAVWAGSEMVIWGGYDNVQANSMEVTGDGAAYDPTTNEWRPLPASPLTARADTQALWTGRTVMILGGQPAVTTTATGSDRDGALYDPSTTSWSLIAPPPSRDGHNVDWVASVVDGPKVLAWSDWFEVHQVGSNTSSMSGGVDLFDFAQGTRTWHYIVVGPQALPSVEDAIWTGTDLYTRGITYNCGPCPGPFVPEATAVYNPAANTWTRLPPDPLGGDHLLSVWTGAALFSFNPSGIYGPVGPGDASVYDPATNTWTRTPRAPFACNAGTDPVWTGQQILLYCPRTSSGGAYGPDGLAYTPAASNQARLNVNVAAGCPPSMIGCRDVVNTFAGPPRVPADPNGGVICRYHPTGGVPSPNAGRLVEQTRLDVNQAVQLSQAIRQLDPRAPTGTTSCPADVGTVAVISFSYAIRADVSLWYAARGCQTLDNGRISAFQPGNPGFYVGFQETIEGLSPPVTT